MGSIRRLESKGTLFLDFRYAGQRLREYTTLPDTSANRKRLLKVLERIEGNRPGRLRLQKTFGKPLPAVEQTPAGAHACRACTRRVETASQHNPAV